jgi:hypothetical protein
MLQAKPVKLEKMVGNLRLLVADDHGLARKGVRMLLEEQPEPLRRPNSCGLM